MILSVAGRAPDRTHTMPTAQEADVDLIRYGDDPEQFGELSRPDGPSKGVVVVVHGGFWRARYDLSLGRPLAASLVEHGWTAYNLEYRRVGNGGGYPQTLDDVAAGIDALASVDELDTSRVITMGRSAGGHLAVWAAGRPGLVGTPWAAVAVRVTATISHAGELDFDTAVHLGSGAARAFMGEHTDTTYADPSAQIPLGVPVRCVHAADDDTVPISQSITYVDRTNAAGGDAELVEVDGGHFDVIE